MTDDTQPASRPARIAACPPFPVDNIKRPAAATLANKSIPTPSHREETTLERQSKGPSFRTSSPCSAVQIGGQSRMYANAGRLLQKPLGKSRDAHCVGAVGRFTTQGKTPEVTTKLAEGPVAGAPGSVSCRDSMARFRSATVRERSHPKSAVTSSVWPSPAIRAALSAARQARIRGSRKLPCASPAGHKAIRPAGQPQLPHTQLFIEQRLQPDQPARLSRR